MDSHSQITFKKYLNKKYNWASQLSRTLCKVLRGQREGQRIIRHWPLKPEIYKSYIWWIYYKYLKMKKDDFVHVNPCEFVYDLV